jgi:hypothetical protein
MTNTPAGYRCRAHPHQPVTWRGKGCSLCPTPGTKKSKRRKPIETPYQDENTYQEWQ